MTEVKYPNEGHTPNKEQKPMYQGVRYSENPLYRYICNCSVLPSIPKACWPNKSSVQSCFDVGIGIIRVL